MTELNDVKWDGLKEYYWRCDCSDMAHFVTITWDDEDSDFKMLELHDYYQPKTWRDKIKSCWKALRGKRDHVAWVLLKPEVVADMIEVLSKHSVKDEDNA